MRDTVSQSDLPLRAEVNRLRRRVPGGENQHLNTEAPLLQLEIAITTFPHPLVLAVPKVYLMVCYTVRQSATIRSREASP